MQTGSLSQTLVCPCLTLTATDVAVGIGIGGGGPPDHGAHAARASEQPSAVPVGSFSLRASGWHAIDEQRSVVA